MYSIIMARLLKRNTCKRTLVELPKYDILVCCNQILSLEQVFIIISVARL